MGGSTFSNHTTALWNLSSFEIMPQTFVFFKRFIVHAGSGDPEAAGKPLMMHRLFLLHSPLFTPHTFICQCCTSLAFFSFHFFPIYCFWSLYAPNQAPPRASFCSLCLSGQKKFVLHIITKPFTKAIVCSLSGTVGHSLQVIKCLEVTVVENYIIMNFNIYFATVSRKMITYRVTCST